MRVQFRKNTSLGTTYIQTIFDNLGLLDAQSGEIYFYQQPTWKPVAPSMLGSTVCSITGRFTFPAPAAQRRLQRQFQRWI